MGKGPIFTGKTEILELETSRTVKSFEGVDNHELFKRFDDLNSIVLKNVKEQQLLHFFAEPVQRGGTIYWYAVNGTEEPVSLAELSPQEYERYRHIADSAIFYYKNLASSLASNPATRKEAEFISKAVKFADADYMSQFIFCYDNKVVLGIWGMDLGEPEQVQFTSTVKVSDKRVWVIDYVATGKGHLEGETSIKRQNKYVLRTSDIPMVKPDGKAIFKGWLPDYPLNHVVTDDITFTAVFERDENCTIRFQAAMGGSVIGMNVLNKKVGDRLMPNELPIVQANEGFRFSGWSADVTNGLEINDDMVLTAQFEPEEKQQPMVNATFIAGKQGFLRGEQCVAVPIGTCVPSHLIPEVETRKGYEFQGWSGDVNQPLQTNTDFYAKYHRTWSIWAVVSRFLLFIALLLLLCFMLSKLHRCSSDYGYVGDYHHHGDNVTQVGGPVVSAGENDHVYVPGDGREGDFFTDEPLPDHGIFIPIIGDWPIIDGEQEMKVLANRLNLFFDSDALDYQAFEQDFKRAYPEEDCYICGADKNVQLIQIEVDPQRKDEVREGINEKLPDYSFFVVDESIMEMVDEPVSPYHNAEGWHLDAIHAKEGWTIDKGNSNVVVAVVDNGFHVDRPEFKDKIVGQYNVFTQTAELKPEEVDHGTHVAGTIAALSGGNTSGIAPFAKLMPVQVSSDGQMTFSSIISGIMYAVNNGADIVNLSIGLHAPIAMLLPEQTQKEIIASAFKNEEKVWNKVMESAKKKNVILVFAAGNDNILTKVDPSHRAADAINVTAYDGNGRAEFSNYGEGSTVCAPGVSIQATYGSSGYKQLDGTSMAAPVVSGVLAVLRSIKPDLSQAEAKKILLTTGKKIAGNGGSLVQLDQAIQKVKNL